MQNRALIGGRFQDLSELHRFFHALDIYDCVSSTPIVACATLQLALYESQTLENPIKFFDFRKHHV